MNTTSPQNETDELDRLFSVFFKAQLKQPWPKAPTPAAGVATSEPSELATTRSADSPRNTPTAPAKARDHTARARFTLAASVALALGTGWFLADGFAPGTRPNGAAPASNGPTFLQSGGANGKEHAPLKKIEEDKAKGDNGDVKIDFSKGD